VPIPTAPAEPTEEMHELLLVVSQVERMERHIEDLTKENERLRAAVAEPSPRSHLDIGVNSPLSAIGVNTPLGDKMEGGNTPESKRQAGVDVVLDDEAAALDAPLVDWQAGVNSPLSEWEWERTERELRERVGELERMVIAMDERVVEAETGEAQAREEADRFREEVRLTLFF
jgi:CRISPR/Cas system endoribonuclease Cas6 (RAMP superfamily)